MLTKIYDFENQTIIENLNLTINEFVKLNDKERNKQLKEKDLEIINYSSNSLCFNTINYIYFIEPLKLIYKNENITLRGKTYIYKVLKDLTKQGYNLFNNDKKISYIDILKELRNKGMKIEIKDKNIEISQETFNKQNKKISYENLKLNDLTLFYDRYFPIMKDHINDSFIFSEERKEFLGKLKSIYLPLEPFEVFGPQGIGKSTSLLAFLKQEQKYGLYLNLKFLNEQNIEDFYRTILIESMNLFSNYAEYELLLKYMEDKKKENTEKWKYMEEIIYYLIQLKNKEIYIIFDQYKEIIGEYNINTFISRIKEINGENDKGLYIIKCSSMNDDKVKINYSHYFEEDANNYDHIYIEKLIEINELSIESKLILFFKNNPLYYYLYLNSNKNFNEFIQEFYNTIKTEIMGKYNNNIALLNIISEISSILKKREIFDKTKILEMMKILPMKYLKIKQLDNNDNNNKRYIFEYDCLMTRLSFERIAIELINELSNNSVFTKGMLGILFEIQCHFYIISGKLKNLDISLDNFFFIEGSIFKKRKKRKATVKKLKRKEKKEEKKHLERSKEDEIIKEKLKEISCAYIRPISSNSEGYDSLILIKINNNSSSNLIDLKEENENIDEKPVDYAACLFQMSINKKKSKILSRNKHKKNIEYIKKDFLSRFNVNITEFHLKYIFPLKCKENNIINVLKKELDLMLFDNKNKFIFYNINEKNEKIETNDLVFNQYSNLSQDIEINENIFFSFNKIKKKCLLLSRKRKNNRNDSPNTKSDKETLDKNFEIDLMKLKYLDKNIKNIKFFMNLDKNIINGSEKIQYLSMFKPKEVIIVTKYNNNYYYLYDEMIYDYNTENMVYGNEYEKIIFHIYHDKNSQIDIYSIIHKNHNIK